MNPLKVEEVSIQKNADILTCVLENREKTIVSERVSVLINRFQILTTPKVVAVGDNVTL